MQDEELRRSYRKFRYDSEWLKELLTRMDSVQVIVFSKWLELDPADVTLQAQLAEYDKSGRIYDHRLKRYREPTKVENGELPIDYEHQKPDRSNRPKILSADQIMDALADCAYAHVVHEPATG